MNKMIEVVGLCKFFGNLDVFKDINIVVCKGEVVGLIGLFGLGKFILLCSLNLLLVLDVGVVWIGN